MSEVSMSEMKKTIADFLELGHVENIISLFKKETVYYCLAGDLINDERYMVRMGMVILFEELVKIRPEEVKLAVPSLINLMRQEISMNVRGDALTLLGVIGGPAADAQLKHYANSEEPQLAEIARDFVCK